MNTKFFRLIIVITAVLSTTGCLETLSKRPAGYVRDASGIPRGYYIPEGLSKTEQLRWVQVEESKYCGEQGRGEILIGAAIGAAAGAAIAGKGARGTGAIIGGIAGAGAGSITRGEYCRNLQTTRGLIQAEINSQLPVETYQCEQVYDPRTKQWVIPEGACRRNIQQQQVLPVRPAYVPR